MPAAPSLIHALDFNTVKAVIEAHGRYLSGRQGGKRANLAYIDLSNMTLDDLDLSDADLTGARMAVDLERIGSERKQQRALGRHEYEQR